MRSQLVLFGLCYYVTAGQITLVYVKAVVIRYIFHMIKQSPLILPILNFNLFQHLNKMSFTFVRKKKKIKKISVFHSLIYDLRGRKSTFLPGGNMPFLEGLFVRFQKVLKGEAIIKVLQGKSGKKNLSNIICLRLLKKKYRFAKENVLVMFPM